MKIQTLIFTLLTAFLLMKCSDSNQKAPGGALKFSETYKAPVFSDAAMLAKIKAVLLEIDSIFKNQAAENHFPGFAYGIVMDGSLVYSGATGTINTSSGEAVTKNSQFRIASMTKSFTTMAIMKLRDEGKFSLTEPAVSYLPELASLIYLTKDAAPVTIEHLMTMTAGFPEDNPWADRQLEDTDEEFHGFIREGIPFSSNPSSAYEYSNLGFAMLGTIITRAAGMPYQQYINENILKPLGMMHTYWDFSVIPANELALGYRWEDEQWKLEPMLRDGAYGCIGGLITSIEDFSKYVAFHLSVYPASNESETGPVKRSTVREMHQMKNSRLITDAKDAAGMPCPLMAGYGYGLGARQDCNGLLQISHSGGLPGFGSNYVFYPEYGIGIMAFSNRTYAPAGQAIAAVRNVIFKKSGIESRKLPESDILATRQKQVIQLINTWSDQSENVFLAENFYLDRSREHRMKETAELLPGVGNITSFGPLIPENQLRGTFVIHGDKGDVEVFFTLSPEKVPKVQMLELRLLKEGG